MRVLINRHIKHYIFMKVTKLHKSIFLFIFLSFSIKIKAQTFYAIILADTKDQQIGITVEKDLSSMSRRLDTIAQKIGYKIKTIVMSNEKFNSKALQATLQQLSCEPNDIIFFYYSAHGYSPTEKNESKFPYLYLKDNNSFSLEGVHQQLLEKHARLCITMGDCCNNLIPNLLLKQSRTITKGITTEQDLHIFQQLFLGYQGSIIVSSAEKGKKAVADPLRGGYYTFSWLEALRQAANNNISINWEDLLKDAENRLQQVEVNLSSNEKHSSIWQVNVTPADTPAPVNPEPTPVNPPTPPIVSFDEMNAFLNQLANLKTPYQQREKLRQQKSNQLFAANANVAIYIQSPENPVEIRPIDEYLPTVLVSPNIKGFNFIERLSKVGPDGKYRLITLQEIR